MTEDVVDVVLATVRELLPSDWVVFAPDRTLCVVAMRVWSDGTSATIWTTESGIAYGWFDDAAGKTFANTTGFVPLVVDEMVSWGELI
jgi:hypothetical protein